MKKSVHSFFAVVCVGDSNPCPKKQFHRHSLKKQHLFFSKKQGQSCHPKKDAKNIETT
jgi:hypothetical protein